MSLGKVRRLWHISLEFARKSTGEANPTTKWTVRELKSARRPIRLSEENQHRAVRQTVSKGDVGEKLKRTLRGDQVCAVEAAQVIEGFMQLARETNEANDHVDSLGLYEKELAPYNALGADHSTVRALKDDTLWLIPREVEDTVPNQVTTD